MFALTAVQPTGTNVAFSKPSVSGGAAAFASTVIYASFVSESLPFTLVEVSETLYVPGALHVTPAGFCAVDVAGVPPWNVHDHDVGVNEERSVKFTGLPAQITVWFAEKSAIGASVPGL